MRRAVHAITLGVISSSSLAAHAADPISYESPPEPAVEMPGHSWGGFYVGVHVGGGKGHVDPSPTPGPSIQPTVPTNPTEPTEPFGAPIPVEDYIDVEGAFGGAQVGYLQQSQSNIVYGVEGDISLATIDGASGGTADIEMTASVRARLGYAIDRFLPYVTGGLAVARVKADNGIVPSDTSTHVGWTVGIGAEYALTDHVSTRLEYRYSDFGSAYNSNYGGDLDASLNSVQLGLNYRF